MSHAATSMTGGIAASKDGILHRAWMQVFLVGLGLYIATVIVTYATENTNLLPTIILLGSFLVPVTFVAWAFERDQESGFSLRLIAEAFLVGGILGVLAASILEGYFLNPSPYMYVAVGLIEELAKFLALFFVARRVVPSQRTLKNGLVLGATVGFGFAAFETAGYALNALLTVRGLDLRSLVETEILRGVLAPVGHGLWTAILGGVLFAAARKGKWKISGAVILTYLGVSALHALWDSSHMIAIWLTAVFTAAPWQQRVWNLGFIPAPTDSQVHLFTALNWIGMALVAAIGIAWLLVLLGRVRDTTRASEPAGHATGPSTSPS